MKPRVFVIIGCSLLLLAIIWIAIPGSREEHRSISASPPQNGNASPESAANKVAGPVSLSPSISHNPPGTAPSSSGQPTPIAVTALPWISAGGGAVNSNRPAAPPPIPIAPPPTGKVGEAWVDLDKTNRMFRDYRTLMGENPVGTNAEIMKAIMGGNPKGAMLGPPDGMSLNGSGELVDQWGTPLFFHQISGTHMEIRSAGPDGKMWTSDDLVLK